MLLLSTVAPFHGDRASKSSSHYPQPKPSTLRPHTQQKRPFGSESSFLSSSPHYPLKPQCFATTKLHSFSPPQTTTTRTQNTSTSDTTSFTMLWKLARSILSTALQMI